VVLAEVREVDRCRGCGDQPLLFRREFLDEGTKLESL
jgi:hypothetical protein